MIPQWEAQNHRPFLVNGVSFIEGLDEQIRAEEEEKENRKVRLSCFPFLEFMQRRVAAVTRACR